MTTKRRLAAVVWTAFLVACVAGLHAVGGPLAPPPLTEPAALGPWLERRQPVEAAVAVVRLAALAMAWYLLAATALNLLARLSGALTLVRWADAVSVPVVRRVVSGAVSLSIAAAATGASAGTAYAAPPPAATAERGAGAGARATTSPPPTMRLLPPNGTDPSSPPSTPPAQVGGAPGAAAGGPAVSQPGAAGGGPGTPAPTEAPNGSVTTAPRAGGPPARSDRPDESRPAATDAAATDPGGDSREGRSGGATTDVGQPGAAPAGGRMWTVRPGDHLWALAERALAEAWGRPPTDAEVTPYWRTVVEANRARLRDPANPDLLFPGQIVALPAPPPAN